MQGMAFHEGQAVTLTADAQINDTAFVATGNSGYVEQITTRRHTKNLMGVTIEVGTCAVVALVHFADLGLKLWVPQAILEASGS